ncbi:uncharacterized protein BYT42DRAFT_646683 [Radiomyces spectabilis]|uniref:uncharacterized protein n=1 Tax=Radiomyces spectabilis TaxID=64574 RepID=UPI00221E6DD5|nr:uncharacterized protein BYT42DRAFT_646683 [Radiomyces spectabilis]KAI8374765.1 hypothetical protein BYT42DRAFT_646683 [Radiomyces spectabilis]
MSSKNREHDLQKPSMETREWPTENNESVDQQTLKTDGEEDQHGAEVSMCMASLKRSGSHMKIVIKPISYLTIQDPQKKKMTVILDPEGDGNCGFRCIAHTTHGDQNRALDVEEDMLEWFNKI